MEKRDLTTRVIGLLVFFLGILILIVCFVFAYGLFTSSIVAVKPGDTQVAANLGSSALSALIRIGTLFIMVLVGSMMAGRGAMLYFGSER